MCKPTKNLLFCTCNEEDNTSTIIGNYEWSLSRYIGRNKSMLLGKILKSSSDLGDSITIERVLNDLNTRNSFDFDYSPEDMDCIRIHNGCEHPDYAYFSVVYKNGVWKKGSNGTFGVIKETLGEGKLKERS